MNRLALIWIILSSLIAFSIAAHGTEVSRIDAFGNFSRNNSHYYSNVREQNKKPGDHERRRTEFFKGKSECFK